MVNRKTVLFTDLDGSLLDLNTYSFEKARPALNFFKSKKIPVIFCSAKTRDEQLYYQKKLGIDDPFIVENGGAIYIRKDYFDFEYTHTACRDGFYIIELGYAVEKIIRDLEKTAEEAGIRFWSYSNLDLEAISQATGLDRKAAQRARCRRYSETVTRLFGDAHNIETFFAGLAEKNLQCVPGGKFYSVMGPNDKGMAIKILIDLLGRQANSPVCSAGVGDSINDLPMLSAVDRPFLVQKPNGHWETISVPGLEKINGAGPEGWNQLPRKLF